MSDTEDRLADKPVEVPSRDAEALRLILAFHSLSDPKTRQAIITITEAAARTGEKLN